MNDLIIVHGALGHTGHLEPLAARFKDLFRVHLHLLPGHGGRAGQADFSIRSFADDLHQAITLHKLHKPWVFGYSMGGYIGLYLEQQVPGTLGGLVSFATKFSWTPDTAGREAAMLEPKTLKEKFPDYARTLQERHHPLDWQQVLMSTAGMMRDMGLNPPLQEPQFRAIHIPVLLTVGDTDRMVSIEETAHVRAAIPGAQMAVLPYTTHPIEKLDLDLMHYLVRRFVKSV
jgi:pimeloyl-ACP methyl ester carboxylesterase